MKITKFKRCLILFAVFMAALTGFYFINKRVKIVDLSTIHVSTDGNLLKSQVKIWKGLHSINRENDLELFNKNNGDHTVYDGFQKGLLNTDYGENDFILTYNNKYYFQFRHFILNNNYQHSYNFHFYKQQNTIYIKADITGGSGMKFTRPMHLISQEKYLCCNNPIDSNKVMYNMLEMK